MHEYDYLIIGGGLTADAAVRGIREIDAEGSIGVISAESYRPYARPPLSKALWKGKDLDSIWCDTESHNAELHLDCRVRSLNPERRKVIDALGRSFSYQKLLLATGGRPRRLPSDSQRIIYFRTFADYLSLKELSAEQSRIVVVGGGFIGSEIAAALAMNGQQVDLICSGAGVGHRTFPQELTHFINAHYAQQGIEVVADERVTAVMDNDAGVTVSTNSGRTIHADAVVAGIGIEPNVELASAAGLEVSNGIRVDPSLRTSRQDIYAAGDVASFYNPALERYLRVEHEDNALTMGRMAGRSMAGMTVGYDHLPFFYSDLFDFGYEAMGIIDSQLRTVTDWIQPYEKGVIYYLDEDVVRGVLLWNVWDQIEPARRLISTRTSVTATELHGRLPE